MKAFYLYRRGDKAAGGDDVIDDSLAHHANAPPPRAPSVLLHILSRSASMRVSPAPRLGASRVALFRRRPPPRSRSAVAADASPRSRDDAAREETAFLGMG
jgi:hypothetical protein